MLTYKLILDSDTIDYRPEIIYVFKYIERCYFIKGTDSNNADLFISYGAHPNHNSDVFIPSNLITNVLEIRNDGANLIDKNSVISALKMHMSDNEIYTTNATGSKIFRDDLIALSFILLSRVEERGALSLDKHKRYSVNSDIVFLAGLYGLPVVDVLMDRFVNIVFHGKLLSRQKYNVKLTHDVDRLKSYHSIWMSIKTVLGDIIKRMDLSLAFSRFKREFNIFEPWGSIYKLNNLYAKLGFTPLFLLMGPSNNNMDSTYFLKMSKLLKRYAMHLLSSRYKIGVHPGYASYRSSHIYGYQKRSIESLLDVCITESRQHVLRFDIDKTTIIAERYGIKNDYTLAYPEILGFRNATSRGMNAFNFSDRKIMNLVLYSTSIVDFTLHDGGVCQQSCPIFSSRSLKQSLLFSPHLFRWIKPYLSDRILVSDFT